MKILLAISLFVVCSLSHASPNNHTNTGAIPCGMWESFDVSGRERIEEWFSGYAAGASENNDLVSSDYDGFVVHAWEYCTRNLDAKMRDAAEAVEGVLK